MNFAQPVVMKLDPYRVATWPLFKEATRYENGECIKVRELPNGVAYASTDVITGHFISES